MTDELPQLRLRIPLTIRVQGIPEAGQLPAFQEAVARTFRRAAEQAAEAAQQRGIQLIRPPATQFTLLTPRVDISGGDSSTDAFQLAVRSGLDQGLNDLASALSQRADIGVSTRVIVQDPPDRAPTRAARHRVDWRVVSDRRFTLRLRSFVDFLRSVADHPGRRGSSEAPDRIVELYPERLDDQVTAHVWQVMVNPRAPRPMLTQELSEQVLERLNVTVSPEENYFYTFSIYTPVWQRMRMLDESNSAGIFPQRHSNQIRNWRGMEALGQGGTMVLLWISLPRVEGGRSYFTEENETQVQVRTRELDFLVNEESFERLQGVPWQNYLDAYGEQLITLHIHAVYPIRRVHYTTLRSLLSEEIGETVSENAAYFGGLYLLNNPLLDVLPSAARGPARDLSDEDTRGLLEDQRFGFWEVGWAGAYIYVVFELSSLERSIALFRAPAQSLVQPLIDHLNSDREELLWPYQLETFLRTNFDTRTNHPDIPGNMFEYFLDELRNRENGRWFEELFTAVEEAHNWDLHALLIELALTTNYANDQRVQRTIQLINERRRRQMHHSYSADRQEIWLDGDQRRAIGGEQRGDLPHVIARVDDLYMHKQKDRRIVPDKLPGFRQAIEDAKIQLIRELVTNVDQNNYSEEEFATKVLERAWEAAGMTEDDIEEITILHTLQLVGLERRNETGIIRYYLRVRTVRKIEEDSRDWAVVENSERVISDSQFEELLTFWRIARVGETTILLSQIVVGAAVLVVAWEVGAIGVLVRIAGGARMVIPAILLSEIFYIIGAREVTLAGLVEAAIRGYMMALGMNIFSGLGLQIAGRIGAQSVSRVIIGWITGRIAQGAAGGAVGAALSQFGSDLFRIAIGEQDQFSSAQTYFRSITLGALVGIAAEIVLGGATVLFAPELRSLGEVVAQIRRAGLNPRSWQELTVEAGNRIAANLRSIFGSESTLVEQMMVAFRERLAQVTVEYRAAVLEQAAAVNRQVLSQAGAAGLRRLTAASVEQTSLEDMLSVLNRMRQHPGRLNAVMETMTYLDDRALSGLIARGQLEELANAPYLRDLIALRGSEALNILNNVFDEIIPNMERFLSRVVRLNPVQQTQILEFLARLSRMSAAERELFIALLTRSGPSSLGLPPIPPIRQLGPATGPEQLPSFVESVTGLLPPNQLQAVRGELRSINPQLETTLEAIQPRSAGVNALRLIYENRGLISGRMSINAVRGVADMVQLERGISISSIHRLFNSGMSSTQLGELFENFHAIAQMPGAQLIVDESFTAAQSLELIRAYREIRGRNIQLPENMSRQALRGLLRWVNESNPPYIERLLDIRPSQRLARLEAASPIVDPSIRPPSRAQELLRVHTGNIRPGLNPLHGTPEEFVQALEHRMQQLAHPGRFLNADVRGQFIGIVRSYRNGVENLQAGGNVERNVEGAREEIDAVITAMEEGGTVFTLGARAQMTINPGLYPFPGGGQLINAPSDVMVQLDVGARQVNGNLLLVEATTGTLSLPNSLRGLASQSGGTYDWNALDPSNASHRKWMQIIKIRAAAIYATQLGNAFGHQVLAPELSLRVSRASVDAKSAAEILGWRVIETGEEWPAVP